MKKLALTFSLLVVILSSCSSSDTDSTPLAGIFLKKSIDTDSDGTVTTLYTYNGNKIVNAISDNGLKVVVTYTGNLITKMEYFSGTLLGQTDTYTYNTSSQLVTFLRIDNTNDLGDKTTYIHNSDGTISFISYFGDVTSQTAVSNSGKIVIENSEIDNTEFYTPNSSSLYNTVTYTFDTKNNLFANVIGFEKIYFNEGFTEGLCHNVLSETHTSETSSSYTSVFNYNSDNFPTSVVTTFTDSGDIESSQFFYE